MIPRPMGRAVVTIVVTSVFTASKAVENAVVIASLMFNAFPFRNRAHGLYFIFKRLIALKIP